MSNGCLRIPALCAGTLLFLGGARAQEQPRTLPLEERVDIQVAEFTLLVTDKAGRPVTDLSPAEITVYEGKKKQRLAFLDLASKQAQERAWAITAPAPAPLFDGKKTVAVSSPAQVPAPAPVRRVILAFDAKNSRLRVRETWREAARAWIESSVQPGDRVAVAGLGALPEWFAGPTGNREELLAAIDRASIPANTPNRDRIGEMTRFVEGVRTNCASEASGGGSRAAGSWTCAAELARPAVDQWWRESLESIEALRALVGQLAAFPDRKTVILFSEGIIPEPGEVAGAAIQSVLGSAQNFTASMTWSLDRNVTRELKYLQGEARAALVSFWALDTRPTSQRRQLAETLENPTRAPIPGQSFGVDPWTEMYETTRGVLKTLAQETSGRYAAGTDSLLGKLAAAGSAESGAYLVGYYRSEPGTPLERIKVKLSRRGVEAELPQQAGLRRRGPRHLHLDISIGAPEPAGAEEKLILPVKILTPFDELPLRKAGAVRGCQIGLLLQAIRPDGTLAGEVFEEVTAVREESALAGGAFEHLSRLLLDPGPYRLRARISDDRSILLGDTIVDLTVTLSAVSPGF